jgi:hypothetical protein
MFKIGQKVKVKEWKEMIEEFGLDEGGDINCALSFVANMRKLCGEEFIIKEVFEHIPDETSTEIEPDYNDINNHKFLGWAISSDMVKLVE